jgi:hypothetical protein
VDPAPISRFVAERRLKPVPTGSPALGIAAYALAEVLNAPKLRDIRKSIQELARENQNALRLECCSNTVAKRFN